MKVKLFKIVGTHLAHEYYGTVHVKADTKDEAIHLYMTNTGGSPKSCTEEEMSEQEYEMGKALKNKWDLYL